MDAGTEAVTDPAALTQINRQARRVHMQSLGAALAVTAVVFLVPI